MMVAFDKRYWFIPDYITVAYFKVLTILEKNKWNVYFTGKFWSSWAEIVWLL